MQFIPTFSSQASSWSLFDTAGFTSADYGSDSDFNDLMQEALEEAANLLTDRARTAEDRLQSFRDKLCEGITAYRVQLPADAETVPAPSSLWRGLKGFEPARALLSYVEVSLGKQDIEYILLDICETWAGNFSRSAD